MSDIFLHKATSMHSEATHKICTPNSQYELIYCLNGKFSYVLNNSCYICKMNEFIVIPPNTDTFIYEDEATCLHWQFNSTSIYKSTQIVQQCDNSVLSFKELLLLMLHEKENNDAYTKTCLIIYEKILLLRLMSPIEHTDDSILNLSTQLRFVLSYFKKHYSENINIPVLLEKTGYSYNYMRHLFKSELGISPKQYLTQIRLAQAQNLIANTDLSVGEIAARCGFGCVSRFNAAYKKAP